MTLPLGTLRLATLLTAALLLLLASSGAYAKPRPPLCPGGRFLVREGAPLLAPSGSPSLEAVTIAAGGTLDISSGCPTVPVRLKRAKKGTRVSGRWPAGACTNLKGRARLSGRLDADCKTLRGTLRAKKVRRRFTARLSECGDGILDGAGGERCDRLEGTPEAPALSAIVDLDLEGGVSPAEVDVDADGARVVRTRLDIGFSPTATLADVNRVLDTVGGRLTMMVEGVSILLVRIPDPGSVAGLEGVARRVGADPAVRFVDTCGIDEVDTLPDGLSLPPAPQSLSDADFTKLAKVRHLLAVRAAAAWNARRALRPAGELPAVVVVDAFGDGAPDGALAATYPDPSDFAADNPEQHGYHVAGIITASFGGGGQCDTPAPFSDATRECATGMFPGSLRLRAVDVAGPDFATSSCPSAATSPACNLLFRNAKEDKTIQRVRALLQTPPHNVVVNESLGVGCVSTGGQDCFPEEKARGEAVRWIEKLRGGFTQQIGASLEGSFLHVVSAGNVKATRPGVNAAAINSIPCAAALLSGLADGGGPIPNLLNVLAVENLVASTAPFNPLCLSRNSFVGGSLAAIGARVFSLAGARAGAVEFTGTSQAAPAVAGLAAYVWGIDPLLTPIQLAQLLNVTALGSLSTDFTVDDECGQGTPAPIIDAYEAVLSLDAADAPSESNAPVRFAILDADADGDFDRDDLGFFVGALFDPTTGSRREPPVADYSRFDLNGDGFTGVAPPDPFSGSAPVTRFDLDRVGSQHRGAPRYNPELVTQVIEGVPVPFDERNVSDVAVLCFYAYSGLFRDADADVEARRQNLSDNQRCFRIRIEADLPAQLQPSVETPVVVSVAVLGPDGAESAGPGLELQLTASGGDVGDTSGTTDDDGEFQTTVTLAPNSNSVELRVEVRAGEDEPVLAERTFQALLCAGANIAGAWNGTYAGSASGTWAASFTQSGTVLGGTVSIDGGSPTELTGTIECGQTTFGAVGSISFTGSVSGDCASGSWQLQSAAGSWTGCRGVDPQGEASTAARK